jgi:hypothetical protein
VYSDTNGVFPTVGNGLISKITFKSLNAGDYPIWSALRLVSTSPTPAGVTNLVAAAQTLNSTQNDFVTLANLKVWHSHFPLYGLGITTASNGPTINPLTPNDLCNSLNPALPESGGDAGGANIQKQGNLDFCADYNVPFGLINRTN